MCAGVGSANRNILEFGLTSILLMSLRGATQRGVMSGFIHG